MSNLQLTNSLSRKKEIFKPINSKKISLYACGPTVYDNPHVGNARSLVVFDILFRVLRLIYGTNVIYVRNITDVDDKIIEASKRNKKSINEITNEVTKVFHENCRSLNCLNPTIEPKATEHIKEMIEMTSSLIKKGYAYENKGHVYFAINSFNRYGKLSNKNLEELKAGSRAEISDLKKNPLDFVLWKPSEDNDPTLAFEINSNDIETDKVYSVTVSNIIGTSKDTITYSVKVIDPYTLDFISIEGPDEIYDDSIHAYNFTEISAAESYELLITEASDTNWIEGAETIDDLKILSKKYNYRLLNINPFKYSNQVVSSTKIIVVRIRPRINL